MLVATGILFSASSLQAPSGSWIAVGPMNSARSGASAVLLQDGRILVTGGDDANGPSNAAEFFGANGSFSLAAPMNVPRSRHISVAFQDGRILVAGGITSGGSASSTAEIFDPIANSWTNIALGMMEARSGATASLLPDGRVVVAGGQNGTFISSTIEVFDPSLGAFAFAFAGTMSSPRTQHAMAVFTDGRVLIVGGNNGTAPVGSTDIFDPIAGTVSAGPSLSVARFGHSATTLLNGLVVVIGGNNGNANPAQMDVTPAELFDPAAATPAFTTLASTLATPREGHLAFLLPNNNNVLIVGGASGGAAVASAELFTPQESPQGVWTYVFGPTGSMTAARSGGTGATNQVSSTSSVMQRNGVLLIAGGKDANGNALNSAEAYGFPTVQTDQGDYPPGTTVNIAGSGWKPGETVTIQIVESPLIDTHGPYSVTADANGNISDSSFSTDFHDLNVKFTLTALGSVSQAQTTFTDSKPSKLTITTPVSVAVAPGGTANYSLDLSFSGTAGSCSSPMTLAYTGSTPSGTTTTFTPTSISGSTTTDGTGGLALATSVSTASGSYPFTITANQGTCNQSGSASAPGTLVVGATTGTKVGSVAVTSQTGTVTYGTGGSVSYTVTVIRGASGAFTADLTIGALPSGVSASFSSSSLGFAAADTSHTSTLTLTTSNATPAGSSNFEVIATNASASGDMATNVGTLAVNKATPTITWSNPADITYGTPLGAAQLNATASVPGSFVYTPASGAVLNTGNGQTLHVAFTPTDTINYNSTSRDVTINVNAKTLTASIIGNPTKPYDGNTNATLTATNFSLTGLVGTDSFTVTKTSGTYNSKDVATANNVTASFVAGDFSPANGALASNYVLPTTASGAGHITPANATWTTNPNSKTYGDPDPSPLTTGSGSNFIAADGVTATYSRAAGETVLGGPYHITATLAPAGVLSNYNITNTGASFTINKATLTVTADNKVMILHGVLPMFTASYSGFKLNDTFATAVTGSPSLTTTATSASPVGTYQINAAVGTLAANNYTFGVVNGILTIQYASGGICDGDAGRQILQPINASGTMSVFKMGSTVPTKFRVCDANGVSVGTPGVVTGYGLTAAASSSAITVDEDVYSTTPDTAFRWDSTGQQWIFNQSTKNNGTLNQTGMTYFFTINLNDGTSIYFQYGLK
jgi:hypothetical protein